ncbi:Hypothetical protein (Fragment) [Durusdinium trenchii]|uniref:UBX domain-containing protein n=1 Tax=Durusdinium trenchii TaxID=1381693 RepID=A0ABP0NIM7_9DINO
MWRSHTAARTAGPWDSGSFAQRRDHGYCWVELVDGRQAYCHFGDGATGILDIDTLEPVSAQEVPSPTRFEGGFEAARAEAFRSSKLLVVSVVSGRGKPVKEEAMQYMALAAEEVRTVLRENAVFWRGRPSDLRDTQLRQLAPVDMLPSLAIAVTLAADAMTEPHAAQSMKGRPAAPDVPGGTGGVGTAPAVLPRPETRPPPMDDAQRRMAEDFLAAAPSGALTDPVRLVLKLPSGERVERSFEGSETLARVRHWATCCPWLPEAEGRRLQIPSTFQLAIAFPRCRFVAAELERSLRELGLAPSAALLLIEEEAQPWPPSTEA